jgi:hypothetical protein
MSMNKVKFKVSDKLVKQRDGASYSLANYIEGVDYVMRGCFKGVKAVFRADILTSEPQPESQPQVIPPMSRVTLELDEKGLRITWPNPVNQESDSEFADMQQDDPQPEDWRPLMPEVIANKLQQEVMECKIERIYPNFKWVETDQGRVWVGLKGQHMKRGMVIKVKNGELYLGKTGPSGSMVRI